MSKNTASITMEIFREALPFARALVSFFELALRAEHEELSRSDVDDEINHINAWTHSAKQTEEGMFEALREKAEKEATSYAEPVAESKDGPATS